MLDDTWLQILQITELMHAKYECRMSNTGLKFHSPTKPKAKLDQDPFNLLLTKDS